MTKRQYLNKLNTTKTINRFKNFYCDFETVLYNGQHYVTCYSIVGQDSKIFKIIDINELEQLPNLSKLLILEFINNCLKLIIKYGLKKNIYIFFFHNLNKFDSYFILNALSTTSQFDIKLITRNNQVYKITLIDKTTNTKIEFRDSLLYLPISLEELSNIFCFNYKKLNFNHSNSNIKNYINNPDFKKELINYCLTDALVLQEGFENFLKHIRIKLDIEPLKSLSLPGISLRYYRSKFYDDKNLPIERLDENKDSFIRKGYRGGIVELFKPHLLNGYHYDVNSLYPFIMKSYPMPIDIGEWTDKIDIENFFGFIKVEVTSPENIRIPFLSYYDEQMGLISPIGTWTEVYFSEEIKYALTLGYKFKYIHGISYKKSILFDKFIDSLYTLRLNYPKQNPLNFIAKLLMNSLYGRFGMRNEMLKSKIIDNKEITKYISIYDVSSITTFTHKSLVSFNENPVLNKLNKLLELNMINIEDYYKLSKKPSSLNESSAVQIAAAITAYSRIYIDRFKRDTHLDVYYSDTDSIFCKNPLPISSISDTELGKFKLESKVKEGLFLSPKVYMVKKSDNTIDIKFKGLNKELLTETDIYDIYYNSTNVLKKISFNFKRNLQKFIIFKQDSNFNIFSKLLKRNKMFINNKWINTNPLTIKK